MSVGASPDPAGSEQGLVTVDVLLVSSAAALINPAVTCGRTVSLFSVTWKEGGWSS